MSLTDEKIMELAKLNCSIHGHVFPTQFARAIEAEATKPKFHTTELRNPPEAVFNCGEATKPCVCGDSSEQGVFHRNDGPCYIAVEEATKPQEPVGYQELFDAIAAATSVACFPGINISIEDFTAKIGPLFTTPQPCQSCAEKQSAIDVWEGRYADLSAKCAELEDFCISQGNELAKLDEKVFDQDRLLKQQAEKISATLVALAGLPDGALDGGWTYAGMNKYTLGLEADRDALAIVIQKMRDGITTCLAYKATPSSELLKIGYDTTTIIKRHDAAVLKEAVERLLDGSAISSPRTAVQILRGMIAELEKS